MRLECAQVRISYALVMNDVKTWLRPLNTIKQDKPSEALIVYISRGLLTDAKLVMELIAQEVDRMTTSY